MRLLTYFTTFTLIGLLAAAPIFDDDNDEFKITLTKNYNIEKFVKYEADHDIVKLVVPLNSLMNLKLNNNESKIFSSESNKTDSNVILFFVEADVQPDGSRVDQGLYVFREGKAKKILDYGRDAAASVGEVKTFFGAKDGLYVYNFETNSADKYGPITDSIIAIEKETNGDVIYILTEDRELYKVTDNGEKKEKLDDVVNAKVFFLDYENNLYFYADDKKPYVRTADGIKKIEGLPESTGNVILFKPLILFESGAPVIINNDVYIMYPNGTSAHSGFGFNPDAIPTALAPEKALIQYYAFDKKIYEYNVFTHLLSSFVEEITDMLKILQTTTTSCSPRTETSR